MGMQIALLGVLIVSAVAVFAAAVRSGRPLRRLFSSGIQGLCAIGLVNLTAGFTGVSLGFSWLTVGCGALLGIPGTIGLVLMQIVLPLS
jgi:hypothetical protein